MKDDLEQSILASVFQKGPLLVPEDGLPRFKERGTWGWDADLLELFILVKPLRWRLGVRQLDGYFMIDFGPINVQIGLPLYYRKEVTREKSQ